MKIIEKFDPGRFPSFVHPAKKKWIKMGDEQLNELLPKLSDTEKTYLEMITSDEYQQILSRFEKYGDIKISKKTDLPQLVELFSQAIQKVLAIEAKNTEALEKLAIQTVLSLPEFEIVAEAYENGDVFFDVKLGNPDSSVFKKGEKPEEGLFVEEEQNIELAAEFEEIQSEAVLRRRLANIFIHGAATTGMYTFNMVSKELKDIDSSLVNLYGVAAVGAQLGYWVSASGVEKAAVTTSLGGSSQVIPKGEEYTIKARAIIFPYLVHEIIKGIYEWLSIDPDLKAAMQEVDSLESETGDIITGPGFIRIFRSYVSADKQEYLPLVYRKLLQLPKEDIKQVLARSSEGKRIMDNLLREAEKDWEDYKAEKTDFEISKGFEE